MNKYTKIICIALLACLLGGLPLRAQSFQWTRKAGVSLAHQATHSYPSKILCDSKDNIYYCFFFSNSNHVTIEGREVFKPSGINPWECCAVVCYDCEGNMKWYRTIYGNIHNASSTQIVFNSAVMINDTLVINLRGLYDELYFCDSSHVLDTVHAVRPYPYDINTLWISTEDGRITRTASLGWSFNLVYSGNKLYCLKYRIKPDTFGETDSAFVFTSQGEKIRSFTLDFTSDYSSPTNIPLYTVFNDKYYILYTADLNADSVWFGSQLYVDTMRDGRANTILACFDSTGQCLWSREIGSISFGTALGASRLALDTALGKLYLLATGLTWEGDDGPHHFGAIFDGDTMPDGDYDHPNYGLLALGCYDTLGNKLWVKHSDGQGAFRPDGMSLLPGHRLAIGGTGYSYGDGYATLEGFQTNVVGSFIAIYDAVMDSFVLLQTMPGGTGECPTVFNADKDGNLLFAGYMYLGNSYVVCGQDTIYSGSACTSAFYGRYGWPCDSAAHWPGPPQYTLTLGASPAHMGYVTGDAGLHPAGSLVDIRAFPFAGFEFDHWSDGGNENPRHILLLSDSTITAYFVEKQQPEGIATPEPPRITLYPNPATDEVTLRGLNEPPLSIEVLDMTGRAVATFGRTATFDVSRLPQGCYIVAIQTPSSRHHLRLVRK